MILLHLPTRLWLLISDLKQQFIPIPRNFVHRNNGNHQILVVIQGYSGSNAIQELSFSILGKFNSMNELEKSSYGHIAATQAYINQFYASLCVKTEVNSRKQQFWAVGTP